MKYGFVIDNRKCIGCHACTVACKTENHVPVGVNRTWVKYVEKGVFPNTRRVFQVTRCNHCEKPPCVTICPVTAMYQRKDGIVDFNSERCIGCKACMQACPYDSIYMDPDDGTATKCHFCAHRTEVGLEPACVIVCPEHAIIAGDLSDPASEAAQLVAREPVRVRKPEQGTQPKLYYIDADESAIVPTAARHESIYMWSQRNAAVHGGGAIYPLDSPLLQKNALAAYDVSHARPWGWQVPAYCWTKSIGSGALAVPAIAMLLGRLSGDRVRDIALATVALLFTALTTVLLVWDLDHKERFLQVVFTPQSKSWLARGAFILIAYSALCGVFWLAAVAGFSRRDFIFVVAHGAGWILRGRLHCVSLWTMRRARSVANAAAAGTFGRSSIALWSGGAGAASGSDRWFAAGAVIRGSHAGHHFGIALADVAGRSRDAPHHRQCPLRGATDDPWTDSQGVLGWSGCSRRDHSDGALFLVFCSARRPALQPAERVYWLWLDC